MKTTIISFKCISIAFLRWFWDLGDGSKAWNSLHGGWAAQVLYSTIIQIEICGNNWVVIENNSNEQCIILDIYVI